VVNSTTARFTPAKIGGWGYTIGLYLYGQYLVYKRTGTKAYFDYIKSWMDRFVDYMTTKRGMADALRAVIASGGNPYAESRGRLIAAISTLLAAGAKAGTVRSDVAPADILASLGGVTLAAGEPAQSDQARRLLNLLMDGLRYRP